MGDQKCQLRNLENRLPTLCKYIMQVLGFIGLTAMTNDHMTTPYGGVDWLVDADRYQGVVRRTGPMPTTRQEHQGSVTYALVIMVGSQGLGPALKVGVGTLASGLKRSGLNAGGRP